MAFISFNLFPNFVNKFLLKHIASKSSLLWSNVPGLKGNPTIQDKRIISIFAMSPNSGDIGLSVTCVTNTDNFIITIYSDEGVIQNTELLRDLIEEKVNLGISDN